MDRTPDPVLYARHYWLAFRAQHRIIVRESEGEKTPPLPLQRLASAAYADMVEARRRGRAG